MNLHFNPFSITLLMSGVAALLVSLVLFQRSRILAIFWFAMMMMASSIWAVFYSFELSSRTLEQMLFWINLEYIGISFLPATWIMFIVHFIGKKEWLSLKNTILIFSFPLLAVLFVWTNSYHHVHYEEVGLDNQGPFPLLSINPGPWYHIHTVYFYFLLAAGMFLLGKHYAQSELIYRKQTRIILIGATIPWITNFIYLLGFRPYQHIDLTPYAFILTSLVIAFGLSRYQLFSILPFAREKLVDNIREGMLVVDSNGKVIHFNKTMQKFLSSFQDNIIGNRFHELFPAQHALLQMLQRKMNGKEEITLRGKNDEDRFYEVSVTSLQDDRGSWIGTLLVFWDISNRKRTTEKLKTQSQELHALNEVKSKLFSIIAHDLRSPLASLNGLIQLSKEEDTSEQEIKDLLPLVSKDLEYTTAMLDNLLHWAKSQLKGETVQPECFDLCSLINARIEFFQRSARDKNINLIYHEEKETLVFADKSMINMVIHNLLSNAIKYCRPGDSIMISTETDKAFATFSIKDTGIGMNEEVMSQLFELGQQSRPGTQKEKGTGLGLRLCKEFVEKNEGSIWAESQPDRGSTFYFNLKSKAANLL